MNVQSYTHSTSPANGRGFVQANSPTALDLFQLSQDGLGYVQTTTSPQPSGFTAFVSFVIVMQLLFLYSYYFYTARFNTAIEF